MYKIANTRNDNDADVASAQAFMEAKTSHCMMRGHKVVKTLSKQESPTVCRNIRHDSNAEQNENSDHDSVIQFMPPGRGLVKNKTDAANYVAEMLAVLRNIAKDVDLKFLTYLLEMAYEESLSHADASPKTAKPHAR